MPLFSRKGKDESKGEAERITWATNAPAHWPRVGGPRLDPRAAPELHILAVAGELSRAVKAHGGRPSLVALRQTRLDSRGLVDVPIEVEDDGHRVAVLPYAEAGAAASAHFAGVTRYLRARGEPHPVYFAPEPLNESAEPQDPHRPFDTSDLSPWEKKELPAKEFALWWPTSNADRFATAPAFEAVGRAFRALDRIESYIFGFLLHNLGQLAEPGRVRLPEESATIPGVGPEGRPLLLVASAEKGLHFAFPVETTPPAYRDAFLAVFAEYAEGWKRGVLERGFPLDPEGEFRPLGWWEGMEGFARLKEAAENSALARVTPITFE